MTEVRIKINKEKQKKIFEQLLDRYGNNFKTSSEYLCISRGALSKYKRGIISYIPKSVLYKIIKKVRIRLPKIKETKTLNQIRKDYLKKAREVLRKKYGKLWAKELVKRREQKGIGIEYLPNNTFVYIKKSFRKELLKAAYNLAGGLNRLSEKLTISPSTIHFWYYGEQKINNKKRLQFVPLSKLKKILKILELDNRNEFSLKNIEKNIIMYRMRSGNPIKNPKFPIKESPSLTRLLFHLLGDGYDGGKKDMANYRNTCRPLLEEFESDLKIFGRIQIYKQKNSIKFPRLIAQTIKKFYSIKFKTFESRINKNVKRLPKKLLMSGIRAFVDDEGSAYPSFIRVTSANYYLLRGIHSLLDTLNLQHGRIKLQKNKKATYGHTYYLDIRDTKKYLRNIGFTHPKKRRIIELSKKIKKI